MSFKAFYQATMDGSQDNIFKNHVGNFVILWSQESGMPLLKLQELDLVSSFEQVVKVVVVLRG